MVTASRPNSYLRRAKMEGALGGGYAPIGGGGYAPIGGGGYVPIGGGGG
uniref:Uncharacterized protein n=1 Tax=viral metagenome TaxID=1070528 RepID=A0A6M3KU25_9ZZZZ